MRIGGIADAVHALHDGVHRGVVTDGRVGTVEVVVNGAGQTDDGEVELHAEVAGSRQRAVAADDHQRVYLLLLAGLVSLLHTLNGHKLLRAGRLQNGTAPAYNAADILGRKGLHLALDESVVATIDTLDLKLVVDTCACHGANGCVHTGRIATRRQNTDSLNLTHNIYINTLLIIDTFCLQIYKKSRTTPNYLQIIIICGANRLH